MAGEYLRNHGIDIDTEMARIQNDSVHDSGVDNATKDIRIHSVKIPRASSDQCWTLNLRDGRVESVHETEEADAENNHRIHSIDGNGCLLTPSLCHPHVHLDKAFLLSHPKYTDLHVQDGTFEEAMILTGQAKARFEPEDLSERGQRVVDESVRAGVTHMRAFVEVDAGVHTKCLDAGLLLKQGAANDSRCFIQLCAFAQLPLFSPSDGDDTGSVIRNLMNGAAGNEHVEALGSTPYVENDRQKMERNVDWMIDLSISFNKHLDFHLDYNLDPSTEPLVWYVVEALKNKHWTQLAPTKTIVFGHCTRLTLFTSHEWAKLATTIKEAGLPISFVGLPTSDLYMMRTDNQPEIRGTLDVPKLIKDYSLNACIGMNNIGNAFTPQGTCDPLNLACQGVGVYQAGTRRDTELLFEAVSTRAKSAIGLNPANEVSLELQPGVLADVVIFDDMGNMAHSWRKIQSISDAVYLYDHCQLRSTYSKGIRIN